MILGTENNVEHQEFFTCSCHAEGVLVTDWTYDDDFDISLAMFSQGVMIPKRRLVDRIRYAWKHLTTGKLWEDEIILTYTSAEKLGRYLIERANAQKERHIKELKEKQKKEEL